MRVIKMLCGERVASDAAIGAAFRISGRAVNYIKNGKSWRHVT